MRFQSIFPNLFSFAVQEGVKTENNEHINLKVAGQDGSVVQFKIKRHTPLSKLMKAYCERQVRPQHPRDSSRFWSLSCEIVPAVTISRLNRLLLVGLVQQ